MDRNIIHKSIGNLIDIVWTNLKTADQKARRAYISGHFQLLTRQFRPFIAHTITRLRREIILPVDKNKYMAPRSIVIPEILREFNVFCQRWRVSDSKGNFADILPFTQPLIELFDQVTGVLFLICFLILLLSYWIFNLSLSIVLENTSDRIIRPHEFCDIIYYLCSVTQGGLITLINPDNSLSSSLAILLLQGFSKVLLLKALFILDLIVTNLSYRCARWFCSDTDMNPKKLSNFLLVRTAIDAIYRKDIGKFSECYRRMLLNVI